MAAANEARNNEGGGDTGAHGRLAGVYPGRRLTNPADAVRAISARVAANSSSAAIKSRARLSTAASASPDSAR